MGKKKGYLAFIPASAARRMGARESAFGGVPILGYKKVRSTNVLQKAKDFAHDARDFAHSVKGRRIVKFSKRKQYV